MAAFAEHWYDVLCLQDCFQIILARLQLVAVLCKQ